MSRSTISTFKLFEMFPDQETARKYLKGRLWPNGVTCPTCKAKERITTRKDGFYRCNACKLDFTIRTGTIFERSHVPLHKWLASVMAFASNPSIGSQSLATEIGVTQKSAWLILERLRPCLFYRTLTNWPAYRVGTDGSIWTSWRRGKLAEWREMKPTIDRDGYRIVRVYRTPNDWKQCRVCRLVCEAFHGPCPAGMECRHMDGNSANDASDNVTWGTPVENRGDTLRHGTRNRGEKHGNATLTDAQVSEILSLRGQKLQRDVAVQFGTTQSYVSELWSGRRRTYQEVIA